MMELQLLVGISCAVLFFRAADYERMSPWFWAVASLGLSFIVSLLLNSVPLLLMAQFVLFLGMWAYNAQRSPRN